MKILHINTAVGKGGSAGSVELLHNELNKIDGVSSRILAGYSYGKVCDKSVSVMYHKLFHTINAAITRITGLDSIFYPVRSLKLCKSIKWADVVHIHNLHGYYTNITILNLLQKKPIVWTLRDYWLVTGRCANYGECMEHKRGCTDCNDLYKYPKSLFFDFASYMLARKKKAVSVLEKIVFICATDAVRKKYKETYLKNYKFSVVYNSIIFPMKDYKKGKNEKELLYFLDYKYAEIKGANDLIPILKYLADKDSIKNYSLNIIGDNLRGNDIDEIKEIGIKVKEYGYVKDREKYYEILGKSDLLISTTHDETFGKLQLECLAAGTQFVSYDLKVIREVCGDMGLYVTPYDYREYAEQIVQYLNNRENYKSQSDLVEYSKKYGAEKMALAYLKVYREILNAN